MLVRISFEYDRRDRYGRVSLQRKRYFKMFHVTHTQHIYMKDFNDKNRETLVNHRVPHFVRFHGGKIVAWKR